MSFSFVFNIYHIFRLTSGVLVFSLMLSITFKGISFKEVTESMIQIEKKIAANVKNMCTWPSNALPRKAESIRGKNKTYFRMNSILCTIFLKAQIALFYKLTIVTDKR